MTQSLGRYRLVAELARGGMGIVHLAEARGPGGFEKLVVVKELKKELAEDPIYTAMFLEEARLAARLSHPHIVQTNEVGCENGRYFMALELLEGGSLHQIRGKLGISSLPVNMGLRVLASVLDALHHAHELTDGEGRPLGIVHRDVSPQNVFLTFDGAVKLIDFGVAKSLDRRKDAMTRVGVVKGSVPYMSPDHVDGATIDRRADVFAVGIMLREMLTGERLWGDADDMTVLRALIARDLPAFPVAANVPAKLRAIVARAMAPARSDRYDSAAAMRDELESYLADVDPRGSRDDLGAWLAQNLGEERARFREIVRRSRAASATTAPAINAHVWLPSCNLMTRYSGPLLLPAAPPPLPAAARPLRTRFFGPAALFVVALLLVWFGFSPPNVSADRAPRAVDTALTSSVLTKPATAPSAEDETDGEVASAETETAERDIAAPSSPSGVPAAVLREPLPPNPYE